MIVNNEEKHLKRCLKSAASLVDEIVIVDTGSTDRTIEIAKSYGAKFFYFEWINDFSAARNFALRQSTSDWNLVLDADEYILNDCAELLGNFIWKENSVGRIKRIDQFKQGGEIKYSNVHISRLLPKGCYYAGRIHEQVVGDFPRKNINIEVFHDGYMVTNKTERNLSILQEELNENPNDEYVLYQIGKQYKLNEELQKAEGYFEQSYRLLNVNAYYHASLVVDYLYTIIGTRHFDVGLELIQNEKNRLRNLPDFHFICGLFYMDYIFHDIQNHIHLLPLIEQSFLKCLEVGETDEFDSVLGTGSFLALYNLGVYYETTGKTAIAIQCYQMAAELQYDKAIQRLRKM
jgi:glycosyltransferase involved in cell wall biosynthesis